jgi:hypothetical protein
MKTTAVFLLTALFATSVAAAEFGVGLSAKSDDGLIYVPIDVSSKFRVEPQVRFATSDSDSEIQLFPGTIVDFHSETDALEFGVGLFGMAVPKEAVRLYYGARASYIDADLDLTLSDEGFVVDRESQTVEGYRIAPTFGFEYRFNEHFTLGGEVAYFFENLDAEFVSDDISQNAEREQTGTESFLILRYFF